MTRLGKNMTPKQAIKKRCRDCQPEEKTESLCIGCALKDDNLTNLKKIKTYCKWCCNNYNPKDWCNSPDCILYQYRLGHNPARAGIGGKHSQNLMKIAS